MMKRALAAMALTSAAAAAAAAASCSWWYPSTRHGAAYRNVHDFGALGDGVHDDTAAIRAAVNFQQTGGDGSNLAKSAAVVYLPPGDYLISDTIIVWFWTHLVGDACSPPKLRLAANASGFDGSAGLKPVIATNCGFNITADRGVWWYNYKFWGGDANDLFYAHIRNVNVVVGAGNAGATGIFWNVAQQTSIRNVVVDLTASGAIGIDEGGPGYAAQFIPAMNVGGGGVLDSVTILGGRTGLRLAGSQWTYTNLRVQGASAACINATQTPWAQTFIGLNASDCPVAVLYGPVLGTVALLDSVLGPGLGAAAVAVQQAGGGLYLQNTQVLSDGGTQWVVEGLLQVDGASGGVTNVTSWFMGAAVFSGVNAQTAGYLPLPSAGSAAQKGLPLACSGGTNLCGGSAEAPHTGIPSRPRPDFTSVQFANVLDYGAVGDGVTDDTAALRAALLASSTVFLPFGTYAVSDTIDLPCNVTIVGEGLAAVALIANASGFGDNSSMKAMVSTHPDIGCTVQLADITLTTLGTGNDGAVLLEWQSGPDSAMWDVHVRLYYSVGLKARFGPPSTSESPPALSPLLGGGFVSNSWYWAADHNLTDMGQMNCSAPNCTTHLPVNTLHGAVFTAQSPLFMIGTNFEHSLVAEYVLSNASNTIFTHMQTEATPAAVVLDNPTLVTVIGGLFCEWSHTSFMTAMVQANRQQGSANCVAAGPSDVVVASTPVTGLDVSYRLLGLLQREAQYALLDSEYSVPGNTTGWTGPFAFLNTC